jgi:hypothetical protein
MPRLRDDRHRPGQERRDCRLDDRRLGLSAAGEIERCTAGFRAKVAVQPVRIGRSRRGTVERAERRVTARLPSSAQGLPNR